MLLQENRNHHTGLQTLKSIQNEKTLKIFGYCSQFKARLTKKILVFRGGERRTETFGIVNDYNQDLEYSFLDDSGFFSLNRPQGVVKKKSVCDLKVTFDESVAGNYWKRLYCIVKGHWLLQVDCYATVGDVLKRPVPIEVYFRGRAEKENVSVENSSKGRTHSERQDQVDFIDKELLATTRNLQNSQFTSSKVLGVTFNKFEKNQVESLPKIRTVKNRPFHATAPVKGALSRNFIKKGFTTFSKNIMKMPFRAVGEFGKISIYEGFEPKTNSMNSLDQQTVNHEHFFNLNQLKEQFVSFSTRNFFFTLEGQNTSQQFVEVSNNSEVYTFKLQFLLKSKDFKLDFSQIQLSPKEKKTVAVHFSPLQKTLFHHSKVDVVVTNERVSDVNFRDLRSKNLHSEIQKRQLRNCFLGDSK